MNKNNKSWAVIETSRPENFWSNKYGWTDKLDATRFSYAETKRLNLPIGGEWIRINP